jgi:hypothetical protein
MAEVELAHAVDGMAQIAGKIGKATSRDERAAVGRAHRRALRWCRVAVFEMAAKRPCRRISCSPRRAADPMILHRLFAENAVCDQGERR